MPHDDRTFIHWIDADDRITAVNEAWRAFASDNDARDLADLVVGRRLWEFVKGPAVVAAWRMVIDHCRTARRIVTVPYRCDAPGMRRFHSMRVTAMADRGVEFASHIVEQEPREAARGPVAPPGELVVMCAWCKRVRMPTSDWCELESAGLRLGLTQDPAPSISHGMCEQCLEIASASVDQVRA